MDKLSSSGSTGLALLLYTVYFDGGVSSTILDITQYDISAHYRASLVSNIWRYPVPSPYDDIRVRL